jgi:tetratricopeptide (TPR) repeat protein
LASHDRQCLLLLDNCDDPTTNFGNYIPSGPQVSVILTTRLSDASKYASLDPQDANRRLCLRLDGLDTASAAELILEASQVRGRSDMAAQQAARRQAGHIAEFLDCHPLAIVIASSLLQSTAYSLEELAESLKDRLTQKELLDTSTEQATYQRVSATFEMSANVLQKLAASDPSARDALDLLDLLGFMHHQGLSEDVFVRAWNHEEEVLSNCLKKDREPQYLSMWHVTQSRKYFPYGSSDVRKRALLKARAHLIRLTLVKQNLEDNTIYLHALVHLWAKERLKHPTKPWAAAASILALSGEGSQGWEPYSPQLSLHCETNFRAMQNSKGIDLHGEAICKIWCNFAWQMVFCHHPHCSDVVSHFSSEVELTCRTTANDLLATEPQFFLAVLALRDGEASHAAAVLEDVVKVRARLDERHPWRLSSEHELACAYSADGRNSEAIKIFEHVLQRQDNLAEDHPGRLETQHELAGTYLDDGSISKAIAILEHVVYTRKNLPVDHRELLSSQHELARAYLEDEQFDRAIEILERVVAARKISLAIDHPDRLTSQHVLAAAYLETGRSSEAVKIFKHVVRTRSKLAASHPRRLDAQHELARAYLEDDRTSKAIDMYTYVVNVRSKLPATHPDRLVSQHELARAYWCNNQFEEADELMSYVVDMRQRALPEGHRDRILSEEVLEKIRNDEDNPAAVSKGRADFADWQLDYTDGGGDVLSNS